MLQILCRKLKLYLTMNSNDPTVLYLGRADYHRLKQEQYDGASCDPKNQVFGIDIIEVNKPHHIHFASLV